MTDYYRPEIETASRENIESLQLKKLKQQLRHVYENSPFYNKKFSEAGLQVEDIKSLDDMDKIPFTTKEELLESQKERPLFGDILSVDQTALSRIFQTSGTTGIPLKVGYTKRDWDIFAEMWFYHSHGFGLKKEDIVFVPFNYGLFIAWWGAHYGFERMGLCIVPGGGQTTEARIRNIVEWQPTVVCGTPTYILYLGDVARSMGIDFSKRGIRAVVTAGEPGALVPATKKRMKELWGADVFDQLGSSETGPHSFECAAHTGGIHLLENYYIAESVDQETGKRTGTGEVGELILTCLAFEAMPLIRYRMRDAVKLNYDRCECGRTFVRFDGGALGRVDDMINIGAVNVFPSAIENFIRDIEVLSNEYQLVISSRGDKLKVRVEPLHNEISEEQIKEAAEKLFSTINYRIGITPLIEVVEIGKLPRFELKAKRIVKEE